MKAERLTRRSPRIEAAVAELRDQVSQCYPDAAFEVFEGEDPKGTYLRATVDVEDTDQVLDVVIDRLLELQVDEGLPVYFVASRPVERVLEQVRSRPESPPRVWGRAFLP